MTYKDELKNPPDASESEHYKAHMIPTSFKAGRRLKVDLLEKLNKGEPQIYPDFKEIKRRKYA